MNEATPEQRLAYLTYRGTPDPESIPGRAFLRGDCDHALAFVEWRNLQLLRNRPEEPSE